uniref:hypothetical protein n=1 Tax=Neorhizobium sp. EC2-8 TaxID=3129230 RepID=UPI0031011B4D
MVGLQKRSGSAFWRQFSQQRIVDVSQAQLEFADRGGQVCQVYVVGFWFSTSSAFGSCIGGLMDRIYARRSLLGDELKNDRPSQSYPGGIRGPSLEPDNRLERQGGNDFAAFIGNFEGLSIDRFAVGNLLPMISRAPLTASS